MSAGYLWAAQGASGRVSCRVGPVQSVLLGSTSPRTGIPPCCRRAGKDLIVQSIKCHVRYHMCYSQCSWGPLPCKPVAICNCALEVLLDVTSVEHRHGCGSPYTSEDEAKDAFVQFAVSKCCCRTAAAKHVVVRSLTALNTLNKEVMLVCTTVR